MVHSVRCRMAMAGQQRLTREDWTAAALDVIGERGVAGLAVEPLAKTLGTTKGSFYWHFRDREELIAATLTRWEQEETDAVIALLAPLPQPTDRLRQLVEAIFITHGETPDRSIALAAETGRSDVAEVLSRVTDRRIGYVAEQLAASGVDAQEARHRALLAYTAYLGYSTLMRSAPAAVPHGEDARPFLESMMRALRS